MTEVLRLAVAAVEAGEYAQDLGRALRGERRIDTREAGRVEALVIKPAAHVAAEQRDLERFRHIDTRVLQQRRQVVGGRPQDRKSTRLNSSHMSISYAVFCLKKKKKK